MSTQHNEPKVGDTAKLDGRDWLITDTFRLDGGDLDGLAASAADRGFLPVWFSLKGKRGATASAWYGIESGEFVRVW